MFFIESWLCLESMLSCKIFCLESVGLDSIFCVLLESRLDFMIFVLFVIESLLLDSIFSLESFLDSILWLKFK
ncbi:hypothetical protein [Helicobacter saguini]|uniref:hypothetical protein n=1 Tax=Helicobacter saguini TaxID=1548018 RepID=UPI001928863F|nr:hypothetical protein [Helicobacter saguini]